MRLGRNANLSKHKAAENLNVDFDLDLVLDRFEADISEQTILRGKIGPRPRPGPSVLKEDKD